MFGTGYALQEYSPGINRDFDQPIDHNMLDLVMKSNRTEEKNAHTKKRSRPRCRWAHRAESAPGQLQKLIRGGWHSVADMEKDIASAGLAEAAPFSGSAWTPFEDTIQDLKTQRSQAHEPWHRRFLQHAADIVRRHQRRWRTEESLRSRYTIAKATNIA